MGDDEKFAVALDPALDIEGEEIRSGAFSVMSAEAQSLWFMIYHGYLVNTYGVEFPPSMETLARITGFEESKVRSALMELFEHTILVKYREEWDVA